MSGASAAAVVCSSLPYVRCVQHDSFQVACVVKHLPAGPHSGLHIQAFFSLYNLEAFTALQRTEGFMLGCVEPTQQLPAIVQRFAISAKHWAWVLHPYQHQGYGPAQYAPEHIHQLELGCMPALRNLVFNAAWRGETCRSELAYLLTVASQVEMVCLRILRERPVAAARMPLLLQPLKSAAHLHTLWLSVLECADAASADILAAAAQFLPQPTTGCSGGNRDSSKVRCPRLTHLC